MNSTKRNLTFALVALLSCAVLPCPVVAHGVQGNFDDCTMAEARTVLQGVAGGLERSNTGLAQFLSKADKRSVGYHLELFANEMRALQGLASMAEGLERKSGTAFTRALREFVCTQCILAQRVYGAVAGNRSSASGLAAGLMKIESEVDRGVARLGMLLVTMQSCARTEAPGLHGHLAAIEGRLRDLGARKFPRLQTLGALRHRVSCVA